MTLIRFMQPITRLLIPKVPQLLFLPTTKGYGTGSREADNTTHQVKKLTTDNLKAFRDRFDIPVLDKDLEKLPYIKFAKNSKEYKYLKETREKLGGPIPARIFDDPLKNLLWNISRNTLMVQVVRKFQQR